MENRKMYEAPEALTVVLSYNHALMQTSATMQNFGEWITNEWED